MQPRQSIIAIFSTFVEFDADRFSGWATESRLRRSIQTCLQHTPKETSEYFWALYWYKFWQEPETQSLAKQPATAQTIEKWLLNAAKAVRNYLYPTPDSLNLAKGEDDTYELLDHLPATQQPSLIQEIIAQEEQARNSQQAQIHQVLVEAIALIL